MAEVRMPKMGDGMEEGTINRWLKQEGDQITSGEPIAEVETDKANVEIIAYETGPLTKILIAVGQTVPVEEVIAIIGQASSKAVQVNGIQPNPSGLVNARAAAEVEGLKAAAHTSPGGRVRASGLARSIARESGIDLHLLQGSGPNGRVVERDVKAFLDKKNNSPLSPVDLPERTIEPDKSAVADIIPSRMRRAIAERTRKSKQTIPHFYVTMSIEMDKAQAMIREMNAINSEGKVTINDIIVKSCSIALQRVPQVNGSFTDQNTIRMNESVHIGIAVGIEDGLVIPVIRDCHKKTLRQISSEARQLALKAREGRLTPDEFSGGTFSISNLGMMGVDEFVAIINPPESAILAVGGIFREQVVGKDDQIMIRSRMKVTLSADHRILDGVVAARFLQEVKLSLEAPFSLLA